MLKYIKHQFFYSFGYMALIYVIARNCVPALSNTALLEMMGALCLISTTISALLFYNLKLSMRQLWLRRYLLVAVDSIVIIFLLYAFRIIHHQSPIKLLWLCLEVILSQFIICTVIWIVADQNEKRTLKKINARLEENTEKEP